ncbi:hypothetical protein ACXLRS_000774 [Citrobacter youngae]
MHIKAEVMDPLLEYATKSIVELESMLLVDVEDTVWHAEVNMVIS